MDKPFTRRDVGYTVISRFEETLRSFISGKLPILFGEYREGIPNGILEKAKDRTIKIDWEGIEDFLEDTNFPDLKEILFYKNMYEKYFGDSLEKNDFEILMDELYSLRCKIAHVKGYFTSLDLDKLTESTRKIARCLGKNGEQFNILIKEIEEHPEKVVIKIPFEFPVDYCELIDIPNNMPTPDYEYEGGFVGRDEDIKKVMNLLESDRYRVITVSGAGGVGKTALALRVIQKLLLKSNKMFDGIVWTSAKETKLTYIGIEDIEPTIKNYEQLLDTISEVMGFGSPSDVIEKKEADIQTIIELYNCILIVIDNLETITDERIINFILDAHPKTKILITSRKGLGQVERRHELKQLKEKEAIYLFRQIAKDKGIDSLVMIDDNTIKNYVKKVAFYPLAIKWLVGQVAIGKDIHVIIDSIIETTSDISLFCFDKIYNELSSHAKKILCSLSCFDDPPSPGVLNYVVNINQRDFEDGIQDLILLSLVIPEQYKNEQNEISARYVLLSLTRGYVRQQLDKDSVLKRDIEERLRSVQGTIEEAERAKKQYRFSLSNLGAITEEEKVAAVLAQAAFQKYQGGRYIDAVEDYKRARQIAPRFASIYRNWAVMESQEGHSIEADKLMEKAAQLNPKDPQIWLTWGNMKRRLDKIKEALEFYRKAYDLSPDDYVILNAFGKAKSRSGEHEEADKLFRLALQKESTGSSMKHDIINYTSLADNLRRWAESLLKDRNRLGAEEKLKKALKYSNLAVAFDKKDVISLDLLREININLGFFYRISNPNEAITYFSNAILEDPVRFKEAKDTLKATLQLTKIYHALGEIEKAKEVFSKISKPTKGLREILNRDSNLNDDFQTLRDELSIYQDALEGKIIKVNQEKGFTIIESLASPGVTYYGHENDFIPKQTNLTESFVGKKVIFVPKEVNTVYGVRKSASSIELIEM